MLALAAGGMYFKTRIAEKYEKKNNMKRFWLHCRRMDTGVWIVGFLLYNS